VKTYKVDRAHSEAVFQVRHLVTRVRGRFDDFEGTIDYNDAAPEQSRVTFTINAGSINTNEKDRDTHLRSEDFFAVEQFKTITFVSKRISKKGPETYDVVGDLTIRDITREVTLDVANEGSTTDPWGNERVGFSATAKLNRSDFNLTWNQALEAGGVVVGEEVKLSIDAELIRQASTPVSAAA